MSMVVQHNMSAMNANRMLGITTSAQSKSTEKLSSGYRINRAADDAAGLAISEKMRGQIRGLNKASSNAQDGISMIQTAEGALTETHSIIQRMRELAVQATNDTNTDDDRTQIQNEIDQLTQEVDRIANTTEFNTKKLLDGSRQGAVAEKAGKTNVDSTFANSMVSAEITTNGSDKAAFTDIIRIEITQDFTAEQSTKATPKLSDEEIDAYGQLISSGSATTIGNVSVTNAGYNANNSTAENISGALSSAKDNLLTAETDALTSKNAVNANEKAIDTTIDNIFAYATAGASSAGKTLLNDGVTKEDLKTALTNYINLLVENEGHTGSGSTTVANGSSKAITDAKAALDSLFSTDNVSVAATTKTAAALDVAAKYKNSAGGDVAKTGNAEIQATTTLQDQATDVKGKLDTFAKGIAGVQIANNTNQKNVEELQNVVETLSDNDLISAISDYSKAKTDLAGITTTDARVAEYQAKVDDAKAQLDKLNVASSVLTVSDLFGSTDDVNNFEIASKVDKDNKLTINLKNKEGADTVITISNANKLKAGDVITITSEAMVESKQAATGKDAFRLQVGANAGQEVSLGINSMKAKDLNLVQTKEGTEGKALDVTNQASASMAVNTYDLALQKVSTERAKMGAMQNRLEHTISNLDTASENTQNAESRIRDTDMATEMVSFSKNNILAQAGQSMLAQANQSSQGVLSLLG